MNSDILFEEEDGPSYLHSYSTHGGHEKECQFKKISEDLQEKLHRANNQIFELKQNNSQLEKKLIQQDLTITSLQDQVSNSKSLIQENSKISQLQTDLVRAQNNNRELQIQLALLKNKLLQKKTKIHHCEDDLSTIQSQFNDNAEILKKLQEENENLKEILNKISQKQIAVKELRIENRSLRDKIQSLSKAQDDNKSLIDKLQSAEKQLELLTSLKDQVDSLSQENKSLHEKTRSFKSTETPEYLELLSKYNQILEEHDKLLIKAQIDEGKINKLQILQNENDDYKIRCKSLTDQLNELKYKDNQLKTDNEILNKNQKQVEMLKTQLEGLNDNLCDRDQIEVYLRKKIKYLKEKAEGRESELHKAQDAIHAIYQKSQKLSNAYETKVEQVNSLEKRLAAQKSAYDALFEKYHHLKKRYHSRRTKVQETYIHFRPKNH